jgi:O-antigen ligase
MFNRSPVFGQGTASFAQFAETAGFTEGADGWTVETSYPHNLILQFASEYGLVGMVVCLVLFVSAFRGLIPRGREPAWNGILVLLVFFLLSAIVSSGIIDNRTLWGLVVLGLAAPTADSSLSWRTIKQWRGSARSVQPATVA